MNKNIPGLFIPLCNMRNTLFILLIFVFCTGCKKHAETLEPSEVIDFKQVDRKASIREAENRFFEEPVYILLKSPDKNTLFGKIDQIKILNDKIYILDEGIKSLIVFDLDGNALGKVGVYGQGPQEYLDIASFDVDPAGRIYTIDGRNDKLFIYDDRFQCVSTQSLPFEADQLQLLADGRYLFALSSWNTGECKGRKIAVTDRELTVLASYLDYDEYKDDNYWISGYQFIRTDRSILYNQPIDNTIYQFSLNGELLSSVRIDFGKQNTPDEIKKDIERHLTEFDNYTLLRNFTVVTPQFLMGYVWEGRHNKVFMLDRASNEIYVSPTLEDSDHTLLTGFCGSTMISFIDPDYYEEYPDHDLLPENILAHLKKGDFVICLRKIKEG